MAANQFLLVGGGETFVPAKSCPAGSERYGSGLYWPHQGDTDHFLAADAKTKDGSAAVRIVLWRCVYCGVLVVGIGQTAPDIEMAELTFMQEAP